MNQTTTPDSRPPHLPALDGIRGFAALLVLWVHFPYLEGSVLSRISADLAYVSASGYFGVDLFFVLSGFLITRILLAEKRTTGSVRLRRFFARRSLRIFPIYYLTILFCALFLGLEGGALLASLTYTANFAPEAMRGSSLGHAWSLAVEEQFYLLWPMVIGFVPLALLPRVVGRWIPAVALASGVALILVGWESAGTAVFTRMLSLSLGASLAFSELGGARWRSTPWVIAFVAAAAVLIVTQPASIHGTISERFGLLARYLCFPVAAYALLRIAVGGVGRLGDSTRGVFAWRPLRIVGRYSYGLYLYHIPIILVLGLSTHDPVSFGDYALLLFLCFAVPVASYHLIEAPLLRLREPRTPRASSASEVALPLAVRRVRSTR